MIIYLLQLLRIGCTISRLLFLVLPLKIGRLALVPHRNLFHVIYREHLIEGGRANLRQRLDVGLNPHPFGDILIQKETPSISSFLLNGLFFLNWRQQSTWTDLLLYNFETSYFIFRSGSAATIPRTRALRRRCRMAFSQARNSKTVLANRWLT